jgi:hypothetical protein
MQKITQEQIKKLLDYNPDTGVFTWKHRDRSDFDLNSYFNTDSWNNKFAFKVAGGFSHGYITIAIQGTRYRAHRLAFLFYYGFIPRCIDHINGNRSDNRIANLREATYNQNGYNMRTRKSNKSGVKGVSWHVAGNKWEACLQFNGKKVYLGLFSDINEAENAVKLNRKELHAEFACDGR